MAVTPDNYNRKMLIGCMGVAVVVLGMLLAGLIRLAIEERQAVHYPGATQITSHNNYSGLPFHFRWDDSYRTNDPFPDVYGWYSIQFALGAEARALGGCILLEDSKKVMITRRQMTVLLCDTPTERRIYVTRSTSFR